MNFNMDVVYRKRRAIPNGSIYISDDVHGRLVLDSGMEVGLEFQLTITESKQLTALLDDAAKRVVTEIAKQ